MDVDDVVIDPETGLPLLEDGLYWEVSKVEDKIRKDVRDYLRVAIKRQVEKERRSTSTLFLTKEKYFEEEEVGGRDLIDYMKPFTFSSQKEYLSQGYVRLPVLDAYDYSYPMVRYWDQTEENVAKAAQEVYAKYQEDLRKAERKLEREAAAKLKAAEDRARMEYLTGKYPPKKLGGK